MIGIHGPSLLAGFEIHQPEIVHDWAVSTHRKLVDLESIALTNHFKSRKGAFITSIFSIHQFLGQSPRPPVKSFGRLASQMCQKNHHEKISI